MICCGVKNVLHSRARFQLLRWSSWNNSHINNQVSTFAPYLRSWRGPPALKMLFWFCFDSVQQQHIKSICVFILPAFTLTWTQEEANLPLSETDSQQLHALLPKVLDEASQTTLTTEKWHLSFSQAKPWAELLGKAISKVSFVGVRLSSSETLCNEMCDGMRTIWAIQFIFGTALRL